MDANERETLLPAPDPPPVLEYERARPWRPPAWLNPRVSPEVGLFLWAAASYGFGRFNRYDLGWPHFWIGLAFYVAFRLVRWRATLPWKISAAAGVIAVAIGTVSFLNPWAHENWRPEYWTVYNQTYRWNRDASLRVWRAPLAGLAWLVATLALHHVVSRRRS